MWRKVHKNNLAYNLQYIVVPTKISEFLHGEERNVKRCLVGLNVRL